VIRRPEVIASGEVVQVRPALLSTKAAASYLGVSPGFLNATRAEDVRRRARGEPIEGPRWVVLAGTMVRYRVSDLNDWAGRESIPFGTVASRRRPAKHVGDGDAHQEPQP